MQTSLFRTLKSLVLGAGLAVAMCAQATTVKVGRASTETPADQDWTVVKMPRTHEGITGGVDGQMPVITTVLWLKSTRGTVDAAIVLEGFEGSYQSDLLFSASCEGFKPSKNMFVRNQWRVGGPHAGSRDDCLVVGGVYDLAGSLRASDTRVADHMASQGVKLPTSGYVTRVTEAQHGSLITALVLVGKGFKGSAGPVTVDVSNTSLDPAIVQWGVELSDALRASVESWSGKFVLPRIDVGPAIEAASVAATDRDSLGKVVCSHMIAPEIPQEALAKGISGRLVAVTQFRKGVAVDVQILSGPEVFRPAVIAAIKAYQCSPDLDGMVQQEFEFNVDTSDVPIPS